jgi:hypothetical protein
MAVINLCMSSVSLKVVGAERPRAQDIPTINFFVFSLSLLRSLRWTKDLSSSSIVRIAPLIFYLFRFHGP